MSVLERAYVGRPQTRVDGPVKVAGTAKYAAEIVFDRCAHAALVCSSIPSGVIATLDTAAAQKSPGVLLVMTHENAPRLQTPTRMFDDPESAIVSDLPIMQDAVIHWNGEPVAMVVAETLEQAARAASLVRVTYRPAHAETAFAPLVAEAKAPPNILGEKPTVILGDASEALRTAAHVVDNIYRTPRYNHCAIELHAATAIWEEPNKLTVFDASQALGPSRASLARVFGLDVEKVRVVSQFVGGAFGNKGVWSHQILAAAAAKLLERPVRIVLTREEVFRIVGGRTLSEQRVALGAKPDGTLSALIHTGTTAVTAHNSFPEQFTFPARHLYATDHLFLSQKVVELDMIANTSMRAPGESIGTFALESAIDELAVAMRLGPIELRKRIEAKRDPESGKEFSSRHLLEAYARGAERFGWDDDHRAPRAHREGEWWIGTGVATATYPYFRMPGGAARIKLTRDGRAIVQMASHEMGMGTATVQAQYAADLLGLPLERVTFEYGDTDLPPGTIAGGSSQTASIVAAVNAAYEALVHRLLAIAGPGSPLAGAELADLESLDGALVRKSNRGATETYSALLERSGSDVVEATAPAPAPSEMAQFSMHSYGAQFCELRVNDVTGEVRVSRWLGSFDTGRILNPRTAISQFRGGIVMGLGLALTEESFFDERTGRIMNPSLAEYHVPVHLDVPEIDVISMDIPDPAAPFGLHGIGEIGITGVGAAVANAVYNATGKRIRDLPITLDKILDARVSE
jgi:xanthine dehydrogenase YagR molybdenum-binding subunit